MITIKEKSGILSWTKENVDNAPNSFGVFILRTLPTTDSIKFIEASEDIKKDLLVKVKDTSLLEIKFFDWYSTNNLDEATELANSWNEKYLPS